MVRLASEANKLRLNPPRAQRDRPRNREVITLAPKHLPIIATAGASLHRTIVNSRGSTCLVKAK